MDINQIVAAARATEQLRPTAAKDTDAGKVQRLRFAIARFSEPSSCSNVEIEMIPDRALCQECAEDLLNVVRGVMAGRGLPGE